MYIVKTRRIQINCKAIRRAPVNHEFISIPNEHVSLNISIQQNKFQIMMASNIKLTALPKCDSFLVSIIANPIKINSNNSFGKDIGTGRLMSFICIK